MKQTLLVLTVSLGVTTLGFAQAMVDFNTQTVDARIYLGNPGATLRLGSTAAGSPPGTQFLAQLYAAAGTVTDSTTLVAVGNPVNVRGGAYAGYVQLAGTTTLGWAVNSLVVIPFVLPGELATVQLRAWWAGSNGATYTEYYEFDGPAYTGPDIPGIPPGQRLFFYSPLLTLYTGGQGMPPAPPAMLYGLGHAYIPIPEPTACVLLSVGGVGLGLALATGRRRKTA